MVEKEYEGLQQALARVGMDMEGEGRQKANPYLNDIIEAALRHEFTVDEHFWQGYVASHMSLFNAISDPETAMDMETTIMFVAGMAALATQRLLGITKG